MGDSGAPPLTAPKAKYSGKFTYSVTKGRSSFGGQVLSTKDQSAKHSFGTSTRDQWTDKAYLSAEHVKKNNTTALMTPGSKYKSVDSVGLQPLSLKESAPSFKVGTEAREVSKVHKDLKSYPGAGEYALTGSVGGQCTSTRPTAAKFGFGTSTRDGQATRFLGRRYEDHKRGQSSPGPAEYGTHKLSSMSKQVKSLASTEPLWRFSKDGRFQHDYLKRGAQLPAANKYGLPGSCQRQVESLRKTSAAYGFGTSDRWKINDKQYMTKGHEKAYFGKATPGPTTGVIVDSVGSQVNSGRFSREKWSFAKNENGADFITEKEKGGKPGPGTYDA